VWDVGCSIEEIAMRQRALRMLCLTVSLLATGPAVAQEPSQEALTAARELVVVIKAGDQFKAVLPAIVQALKPAVVQGRAAIERDFDAIMTVLVEGMGARASELSEPLAGVYARNFTAAELRELIVFYRSPAGQKLVDRTPVLAQQSMAVGQQFATRLMEDLKGRVTEELRKRGHPL
jgi:hypothetical protein